MANYKSKLWEDFQEETMLDFLEIGFEHAGYNVTNYHKIDRAHEEGTDLLCTNSVEQVAIQAKKKPKKSDCAQLDRFAKNAGKKAIYVFVQEPTKEFSEHAKNISGVEFWNAEKIHKFLVENEVVPYYCLYFSSNPLISSLAKVHELLTEKRKTNYTDHRFSNHEIMQLWATKDDIVKAWVSIFFVYRKWNPVLMAKTQKDKNEFEAILQDISKDLDLAFDICANKFLYRFQELSDEYPDILGYMWRLASNRSNWASYTIQIERTGSDSKSRFFTHYNWICPVYDAVSNGKMRGFYSCMNYLLENFSDIAKNLEDVVDWVFEHMNEN